MSEPTIHTRAAEIFDLLPETDRLILRAWVGEQERAAAKRAALTADAWMYFWPTLIMGGFITALIALFVNTHDANQAAKAARVPALTADLAACSTNLGAVENACAVAYQECK